MRSEQGAKPAGGEAGKSDLELIEAARAGSKRAFSELVDRYKNVVCSVGFALTGSVSLSEDIAQETFVEAWRNLKQLREPGSFRSWVCRIAARTSGAFGQKEKRMAFLPAGSDNLLADDESSSEPSPLDQVISREQHLLVWRALARIPQAYRVPLVLYYREDQSVESVAKALVLTEANVKQRLARGRRMLENELLATIESTLARMAVRRHFTAGVTAAVALAASSAPGISRADRLGISAAGKQIVLAGAMAAVLAFPVAATLGFRSVDGRAAGTPRPTESAPRPAPSPLAGAALLPPSSGGAVVTAVEKASPGPTVLLNVNLEEGQSPFRFGQLTTCPPGAG